MRLASYLFTSRHGVFYFRWPIPAELHPQRRRSDIKVSLGTRSPSTAQRLSRVLAVAGQSTAMAASTRRMRYDEIRAHVREHFQDLLTKFRERTAETGPVDGVGLDALRAAETISGDDPEWWADIFTEGGQNGFLRSFCARRGIQEADLTRGDKDHLLDELRKGHNAYAKAAIAHNASLDSLDLETPMSAPLRADQPRVEVAVFKDVVAKYFNEMTRAEAHAAKTESEKRDALGLLGQITDDKPPALMTKADAQKVKDVLLRLPKNRNKAALTRDLTLDEMLELKGVDIISARTVNAYMSAMQTFSKWAVDNGYATENYFTGMRVKVSKKINDQKREAFSTEQLRTLFHHLTEDPDGLVRKDEHKWGTLIGMFSGMRLNEVAQLEVKDIKQVDGVWCIDVTEDGDNNKRIKNASSQRRVPVHQRLIDCGLLEFVEAQQDTRLFPRLTYSAQNGYGRNIGRWFNEKLLPALDMKQPGLVYHSLRHSMITRLNQSDVQDTRVKAIVGHSQSGVTFDVYFKDGFKPAQLKEAIDRFEFGTG
ncbi:site-specific integrase [Ruegeria sp. 2205SS24-7]|uniref:site-specific integrase n=1 Tax=Ruegeria discodermiae TaxID=3064389 RepID=UPI002742487C|nr:site-specific integrase [Ruegeria sp. 2205SS24-7]MDP5217861.1 site-specific integrase [Ruegeria sp. 2205SS24-7]